MNSKRMAATKSLVEKLKRARNSGRDCTLTIDEVSANLHALEVVASSVLVTNQKIEKFNKG